MFCLNTTKKSETKSIPNEIHAKKMSLKESQTIILLCLRNLVGSIQSHSLQLIRIIHQISGCPTRHTPAFPAGRAIPSPSRTTLGPPVRTSSSCSPGGLAWCSGDQVLSYCRSAPSVHHLLSSGGVKRAEGKEGMVAWLGGGAQWVRWAGCEVLMGGAKG